MEWISVNDSLPQEIKKSIFIPLASEDVLITDGLTIYIGFYELRNWYIYPSLDKIKNITHWMPLPELPKKL